MDLVSTSWTSDAAEVTTNHGQTPSPQMAMECTKVIAMEPLQDTVTPPPQQWGLNNCLTWNAHHQLLDQGEYKDEALSKQVIEGAFLFLEEVTKEAQSPQNKDSLPMTYRIIHKNWGNPQDTATTDKL